MKKAFLLLGLVAVTSGCALPPPTPEQAAARCEERARAAQGPDVGVTIGANSNSAPFAQGRLSIWTAALV